MLINELKRAFKWKKFVGFIVVMIIINLYSICIEIGEFNPFSGMHLSIQEAVDIGDLNQFALFTNAGVTYVGFIPIVCSFVYGLSFLEDRKKGFNKFINLRISNSKYCISKFLANGIVGGLSAALPSIIIFYVLNVFVGGDIHNTSIAIPGIFDDLSKSKPYVFILVFITMEFLVGFAYSTIALAASTLLDNQILVLLAPGVFYYVTNYITDILNFPLKFKTKVATEFGLLAGGVTGYEVAIQLIVITLIFGAVFFHYSRKEFTYER